jgi:hydrogenase nickel incorporation protein HypA/HybF
MHEARLCLSILRLAEEALARDGGGRIVHVELEVGEHSGVAPEALAAAFPICARGTPAEGATLHWRPTPGRELVLRAMEVT